MSPWLAQIAGFLLAPFANVFQNLAGVFANIVAGLPKQVATLLHNGIKFFHDKIASGATWEEAATATLNEIGTEAYADLTDDAKHLLQAVIHKAKP